MRPFQAFRMWARRAPVSERVIVSLSMVIVVGLIGWLTVPDDSPSTEVATFAGDVAGEGTAVSEGDGGGVPSDTAPGADGGATTDTSATAGSSDPAATGSAPATGDSGAPAATAAGGCTSPPGQAKGITATEVRITVALTELVGAAGNELFDIPPPDVARADFEAAIAGINKEGGIACRKLVAEYVRANPVNESQMMQLCREVADSETFALIDTGSLATRPAVLACLGQNKMPYFGAFYITESARRQFYPYMFSTYYKEQVYKDTAFGLRDHGFFDPAKGFKKLGFIYRDCQREAINAFRGWLREAGATDDKRVDYSVGCPALFATDADLSQAVLTFQREGVTHVTVGNFTGDLAAFTNTAERQRFRPKYGFPDEAMVSVATGRRAPNPDNIANALAVTLSRDGENNTPGMTPTAGTQRCNEYRKAAGLPPVYDVPANAGNACSQLWMLRGALSNAPQLAATALQAGLQRTKSVDFSFPQAPNDFTGQGVTTGGQFWRLLQFTPECECWRVSQREFRRGFGF